MFRNRSFRDGLIIEKVCGLTGPIKNIPQRHIASMAEANYTRRMSTITIPLPEEDLTFLRAYSSALGTSAEEFLARQPRSLREHLQRPVPDEVTAASGIILPRVSAKEIHREHLEKKHS